MIFLKWYLESPDSKCPFSVFDRLTSLAPLVLLLALKFLPHALYAYVHHGIAHGTGWYGIDGVCLIHSLHTKPLPIVSLKWGYCKIIFKAIAFVRVLAFSWSSPFLANGQSTCHELTRFVRSTSISLLPTHASPPGKTKNQIYNNLMDVLP
jgi:hypothetical protein